MRTSALPSSNRMNANPQPVKSSTWLSHTVHKCRLRSLTRGSFVATVQHPKSNVVASAHEQVLPTPPALTRLATAANALMLSVALLGGSLAPLPPRAMAENVRLADVENPELREGEMLHLTATRDRKRGTWGHYEGGPRNGTRRLGHGSWQDAVKGRTTVRTCGE